MYLPYYKIKKITFLLLTSSYDTSLPFRTSV